MIICVTILIWVVLGPVGLVQALQLISPVSGASYNASSGYDVTWSVVDTDPDTVNVFLSHDGGQSFFQLTSNISTSYGGFHVVVPSDQPAGYYSLYVTDTNNNTLAYCSGFQILDTNPPTTSITTPAATTPTATPTVSSTTSTIASGNSTTLSVVPTVTVYLPIVSSSGTTTAAPTSTIPPPQAVSGTPAQNELSTGSKAGIGVGVAAAGLIVLSVAAFWLLRGRQKQNQRATNDRPPSVSEYIPGAAVAAETVHQKHTSELSGDYIFPTSPAELHELHG